MSCRAVDSIRYATHSNRNVGRPTRVPERARRVFPAELFRQRLNRGSCRYPWSHRSFPDRIAWSSVSPLSHPSARIPVNLPSFSNSVPRVLLTLPSFARGSGVVWQAGCFAGTPGTFCG
uniref:Uncharacterized protein n=1 Tax=Anopheles atroparvus TaxID=41427 RepID=A0AAG5DLA4_ANOAO